MRIAALLLAVALIVVSGFWLARDRGAQGPAGPAEPSASPVVGSPAADPPVPASEAADAGVDPATTGTPDETEPETSEATPPEATGAGLPEGFEVVPAVSEDPARVFDAAEAVLDDALDYVALLRTTKGEVLLELYEDRTPVTVNNFVFLALNRFYDGVPFHRVIDGFMAQTGDPTGTGTGGPGYRFDDEIVDGLGFDGPGILAMANAGPGTNGSQFFITYAATPWLDGNHTIFGHVLEGSEAIDSLTRVDPQQPSAVVAPSAPLSELADQGIVLPGDPAQSVEEAIEESLGTRPVAGQSFTVAGHRGVLGAVGGEAAYGFFSQPDQITSVVIGARAR